MTGTSRTEETRIHFVNALAFCRVPLTLIEGVKVVQVSANGKAKASTLELSEDKFTLTIASADKQAQGVGAFFRSSNSAATDVRAIDIGEMDRIQRGQSTEQFEKAKMNAMDESKIRRPDLYRHSSSGSTTTTGSTLSIQQLDPRQSFSIIFRGAETLDMMAGSLVERDEICDTLDKILETYQRAKTRVADDVRLLRYVWLDVDKLKTGFVNVHQISQVFSQINFMMKPRDVQVSYEKFGKVIGLDRSMRRRGLSFEQLADFLHYIRRNSWIIKPVTVIWNELFGELMNNGKARETVSDKTFLEQFLQKKQGEVDATLLDTRKLFRRLHDMEVAHHTTKGTIDLNRINKDQFEAFLLSSENNAFGKERFEETDMNQPLSEYFINSSHNTYLVGDQYTSNSRVEMYSYALYRGSRCLELDIWDGGKSTRTSEPIPVVWHGHTMTSKINFVDIIRTIKLFVTFHPDTFPIVLSFENHCSIPYQEVMADQLVRILGDALYIPTESSLYGPLPSPAKLRGMVVIKGRRPDGTEADAYDSEDDSDDETGVGSSMGELTVAQEANRAKVKKHGASPALARLTLMHGHKFKSFDKSSRTPTHHMHSFSESKVRSRCRQKLAQQWMIYNQTHLSRTYPAGSRVDSSNYNPLLAWSTGCQMVALNFQTQDAFLRLNDGRFRENGNCGYVLKPSSLMVKDDGVNASVPLRLSVRILSGSCLPKAKGLRQGDCIDPYVKVTVFDVRNRERETITEDTTSVVKMNGFFPVWAQEKFSYYIENWTVAMLQFTIYDKANKDEFIASSSIPVSCLCEGIRSVKFYDATNTRSGAFDFAALLVELKIGKIVAEI
jgi:hypothetical protein